VPGRVLRGVHPVLIHGRNTKSCHDSFGREHSWRRLHYCVREEQPSAAVVAAKLLSTTAPANACSVA
jgi:hypothetical protein